MAPRRRVSTKGLGAGIQRTRRRPCGVDPLPDSHIVFCEGKTEADCINKLRQHFRVPTVSVHVVQQVGVPSTIVKKAKEEWRKSKTSGARVYAIFDRDAHRCFDNAVQQLAPDGARGVVAGVSVPCIELWGILLHEDQTAHIERDKAQRRLKALHPDYDHDNHPFFDLATVLRGHNDARRRATHLARRAVDAGDPYQNPTTTFSDVLAAILGDFLYPP